MSAELSESRRALLAGALVALTPGALRAQGKPPKRVAAPARKHAAAAPPNLAGDIVTPPAAWTDPRLRLLRRATMGVTAADVDDVQRMGYQQWLNAQVHYTNIDDRAVDAFVAARWPLLSQTATQLASANQGAVQQQLQEATLYRAAFSARQLYERMVEFWSDHFNIEMPKVGYLKVLDDRDVIRKHALGKFANLLKASAHSPAMLAYLDQNLSRSGAPNQNYVRELMELHTLGVDGGYTQQDVDELARVFTGWTLTGAGNFAFVPNRHDYGAKTVLGVAIAATSPSTGGAGIQEGEQMLDVLLNHPSTATFLATKMLKWLLTPEPTQTQISAIASVYRATRGDIKLMVRAILNDAWVSAAPAKFKRPFHYLVSALRATAPTVASTTPVNTSLRLIGQPLFVYETPDGYPDTAEFWSGNITPRWSAASTMSNFAQASTINLSTAPYLAGSPDAAIDKIEADFFGGELALSTRLALLNYLRGGTFDDRRVRETISLALGSAEFQWY